jgi:hypothetical protein
MSRRTLLGAGLTTATAAVAVATARAAGVLDDVLRGLGAEPHPEPDPGDARRLARAATDQAALMASIDATTSQHLDLTIALKPLRLVADEQLVAVGGRTEADVAAAPGDRTAALAALSRVASDASRAREKDAVSAVSPDVARVLASLSAGLSQLSRAIGEI